MLNNFKTTLLTSLMLLFASISLTSCGDDDNDNDNPKPIIPAESMFRGNTVTFPIDNPSETFTTERPTYIVKINDNGTATISIENSQFLEGMPPMNMDFKGIKAETIGQNGNNVTFNLTCEALDPEIGGRPFPDFPISNLNGTLVSNTSLKLTFICNFRGTPYRVNVEGKIATE